MRSRRWPRRAGHKSQSPRVVCAFGIDFIWGIVDDDWKGRASSCSCMPARVRDMSERELVLALFWDISL